MSPSVCLVSKMQHFLSQKSEGSLVFLIANNRSQDVISIRRLSTIKWKYLDNWKKHNFITFFLIDHKFITYISRLLRMVWNTIIQIKDNSYLIHGLIYLYYSTINVFLTKPSYKCIIRSYTRRWETGVTCGYTDIKTLTN